MQMILQKILAPEKVNGEDRLPLPPYAALERDYGFKPSTSLKEDLRKFSEWYKECFILIRNKTFFQNLFC